MIPKIIHYCWFGRGEYSDLINQCIKSWKDNLPDYKLVLWNEDSFDVNSVIYTKEAYAVKKYAFVSDYVRLYALQKYGGIYLDTDVEVIKTFDEFLDLEAFAGYEDDLRAGCGIIGSIPGQRVIADFFQHYQGRSFYNDIGYYDLTPNPYWLKKVLLRHGLKDDGETHNCDGFVLYEQMFFYPHRSEDSWDINDKTVTIHHYDGSWTKTKDSHQLEYEAAIEKYAKLFGSTWGERIFKNKERIKKYGIRKWMKDTYHRLKDR